jgi:MazG family protein
VPRHLPALLQAEKMQKKAAKVGFDWPDAAPVIDKLEEEVAELKAAIAERNPEAIAAEAGDLLFTIVNLSRFFDFNGEEALRQTIARFRDRFTFIEAAAAQQDRELEDMTLAELDALWDQAKER